MADTAAFPYETRLNILHQPLEVIDLNAIEDAKNYKWFNQTLCKVNDSVVRVGIIEGEYHWHKHDNDDEFFYTVEGLLLIDLEDRTVELKPGQGFVVPARCRAPHARATPHRNPHGRERRHHPHRQLTDHGPLFTVPSLECVIVKKEWLKLKTRVPPRQKARKAASSFSP